MRVFVHYTSYSCNHNVMVETPLSSNYYDYSIIKYCMYGLHYHGYLNIDRCIQDKDIKILKRKEL